MRNEYKYIYLSNGDYIQIKFDEKGIVYDRFNKDDEHQECYGWDWYDEVIPSLTNLNSFDLFCQRLEQKDLIKIKKIWEKNT